MPHHLLIPVEGDLELFESARPSRLVMEDLVNPNIAVLTLDFMVDDEPGGTVTFAVTDPLDNFNQRGRAALVWLTGAHVVMTGPVLFTDVKPDLVAEMVKDIA